MTDEELKTLAEFPHNRIRWQKDVQGEANWGKWEVCPGKPRIIDNTLARYSSDGTEETKLRCVGCTECASLSVQSNPEKLETKI